MAKAYVGLSGFSYKEWQGEGLFYPPKLKQADYLAYYGTRYSVLESVGSFTRVPSAATVAKWIEVTPPGFRVAPKMHQKVTHFTRLKPEGDETLAYFVEALKPLRDADKLGPILVQLPPNLKRNDDLLAAFLERLPERATMPWTFEFRNESWHDEAVESLLREHGVGWAVVETDEEAPQLRDTAGFNYVRLRKLAYDVSELEAWSHWAKQQILAGKDVYLIGRHAEVEAPWQYTDALLNKLSD